MNLHEIIKANETDGLDISYQAIHPYKKSLYTYYKSLFCCEPILMITAVFNAVQYCKIVPENDFFEALDGYVNDMELNEEEKENEKELINFQSLMFRDAIN